MLKDIKNLIVSIITSRLTVVIVIMCALGGLVISRLFQLQIVDGEEYLENFTLSIERERSIESTRGNIFDRNGKLLAYNELTYAVTMEDVYDSGSTKNKEMNADILEMIDIVESNGDSIVSDFKIVLYNGNYEFTVDGTELLRFKADIYGYSRIDEMKDEERNATAEDIINYLGGKKLFGIGDYVDEEKTEFVVGEGYTKEQVLKLINVRYAMYLNRFQKYVATTVATGISEETVAKLSENLDTLPGVNIEERTIRKYTDSEYFAHIIGYTGKVSQDELEELQESDNSYDLNDYVGKSGIEKVMELELQGEKGYEKVFVNNMGKVIDVRERVESTVGDDVYLTIDADLQKAAYNIIEQVLAGILVDKIENIKSFDKETRDVKIPIYDVYFQMFNNNLIDFEHLASDEAKDTEKAVYATYTAREESVLNWIEEQLRSENPIAYNKLSTEQQVYESFVINMLGKNNLNILQENKIDKNDEVYKAWSNETISMQEYLVHAIEKNWISVSDINVTSKYSDSQEVMDALIDFVLEKLKRNIVITDFSGDYTSFSKKIIKYLIANDKISGNQVIRIMYEQELFPADDKDKKEFESGTISSYSFMIRKISNLEITPSQLALDPCAASCEITDPKTGDVLALVSYPSYDNNKLANNIDSAYYSSLLNDLSKPLYNSATQRKSAPGSTFKPISSIAGLEEGVISTSTKVKCTGVFDEITPAVKCWIAPSAHGSLNIEGAIENSCNVFFNEVGFRLGLQNGKYNSIYSLSRLKKYADMVGLTGSSGVEVAESDSNFAEKDAVRAAMGQDTHNYTISQLGRYASTLANKGTCYDLTLVDRVTNSEGITIKENSAEVISQMDIANSTWNAVYNGMKKAASGYNALETINETITVAGKTGTAQEAANRPNHALFVGFAPIDDPEIAIAVRIFNGYTSSNAVEIASDVFSYYFELDGSEDILDGMAAQISGQSIGD